MAVARSTGTRPEHLLHVAGALCFIALGAVITETQLGSSPQQTWLAYLWGLWIVSIALVWQRKTFSVPLAGLFAAMLLYVIVPATQDVLGGTTQVSLVSYAASNLRALQMAVLAQLAMLIGAFLGGLSPQTGRPDMVRPPIEFSVPRLDKTVYALFATGLLGLVFFIVVGHASPHAAIAIAGSGYYGQLNRSATGVKILYFLSLEGVAGAALVVMALRLTVSRKPAVRVIVVLVLLMLFLISGGQRARLIIPLIACGMVAVKFGAWRRFGPRAVLISGLAILIGISAVVGVARGGTSKRNFSLSSLEHVQFGEASDLFAPTAGLVQLVPSQLAYVHGRSYLEVVAFPIPRALWPGKPEGEEALVADRISRQGGNSFPEYGEFYDNFGMVGVFIGSLLLALLMERLWLTIVRTRSPRVVLICAVLIGTLMQLFTRGNAAGVISGGFGLLIGTLFVCRGKSRLLGFRMAAEEAEALDGEAAALPAG